MSIVIPGNSTAINIFQTNFGLTPGSQDPKLECEKWQQLCNELLADRERLRAELEKARLDQICSDWERQPIGSMEEVLANVDRTTTLDEVIAGFRRELEAEK
jgi:hypothetical protein